MTVIRWCLGCHRRGEWQTGRCPACSTSPERRARKAMLYNADYRRTRARFVVLISSGATVLCSRCRKPVGRDFDLGHTVDGLWPEHRFCNRSAGGRSNR